MIPRERSLKQPFSLIYWLNKLHVWEKVVFSGDFAGGLLPETSEYSDEVDIVEDDDIQERENKARCNKNESVDDVCFGWLILC